MSMQKKSVEEKNTGFDWTSVDWEKKLFPSEEGITGVVDMRYLYSFLYSRVGYDITPEEWATGVLKQYTGKTYDDLDDEVKALCEELFKLTEKELSYISDVYMQ